ncbi:MAG: hypothetical protein RLZZ336_770 [Cyanobacteriota bacterium]
MIGAIGVLRATFERLVAGMAAGTVLAFAGATVLAPQPARGLDWTLQGLALGGAAGLVTPALRRRRPNGAMPVSGGSNGWRDVVVTRKQVESEEITSFELKPVDGGPLPAYKPGQFLTIALTIPGQPKPVVRTYSLSDYPTGNGNPDHYRLSIKREPAPQGQDVPPGLASNFVHDHVQPGSVLQMRPPAGSFVLDTGASTPIVLISNGVGITPMIAMVQAALAQPQPRPIWFVHGCRNGRFHAFREAINDLAASHPNLKVHYAYSRPLDADRDHYHSQGYVDLALLQKLVQQPADYFLCGSAAFMDALIDGLRQAGVSETAIHFERFSRGPAAGATEAQAQPAQAQALAAATVTFARSARTATWSGDDPEQSLLSLAEAEGLEPPYACRAGVCGTCKTRLLSGEVDYLSDPSAPLEPGSVLVCISRPKSQALTLDL